MNIVSWNCNMAFRKKYTSILEIGADIVVIQECEDFKKVGIHGFDLSPDRYIWTGGNDKKGMAIFSNEKYSLRLHESHNENFQHIVPIEVKGLRSFFLFAVWAMPDKKGYRNSYVGQIWGAVHHYHKLLAQDCIWIGDFNSNAFWDKQRKSGNHSHLVQFFNENNVVSLYHFQEHLDHGGETNPTFFMYKKEEKPYHLDYCFASKNLINSQTSIEIGRFDAWIQKSDHMPLMIKNIC